MGILDIISFKFFEKSNIPVTINISGKSNLELTYNSLFLLMFVLGLFLVAISPIFIWFADTVKTIGGAFFLAGGVGWALTRGGAKKRSR